MKYVIALLLCTTALNILAFSEWQKQPDGKLHLYVFDVGQGDAILLVSPSGKQILIDGGPDTRLLEHLGDAMPFFDRTIELMILSHPDLDHIAAFPDVLRRYSVKSIALSGTQHTSGRYDAFLALLEQSDASVITPDPHRDIDLGDGLVLDVIWPPVETFGSDPDNANNPSFAVRALYNDHSILLAGDIEHEAEAAILASGVDIRSTILKVPHHGSRTSSSTGFLLAIDPDLALISAGGAQHRLGHPHKDIVERYKNLGVEVRGTHSEGTVHISLD